MLGCDSLGTVTKPLIDPFDLMGFFEPKDDFSIKLDKDGKPAIKTFFDVLNKAQQVPVEHMTHMTKLFSLDPLPAAAMFTGITSIGNRTMKSLVEEFRAAHAKSISEDNYSIKDVSDKLTAHLDGYYGKEFPEEKQRPPFELIIGGYGKEDPIPEICRVKFPEKEVKKQLEKGRFGIVFGGQMKEIQRIVFGTDFGNRLRIRRRFINLLRKYRDKVNQELKQQSAAVEVREPTEEEITGDFDFFGGGWDLEGFETDWGNFSEQNAIECVDFFVNIMIKSQQFSSVMPTVGGEVHIALITKKDGFRFVSREELAHEGHFIPKHVESKEQ